MYPIEFLPKTPPDQLELLWRIEFPNLVGMPEVWAPIDKNLVPEIAESRYAVSTYGRVLSLKHEKILPQFGTNCGYLRCNLMRESVNGLICRAHSVHRLVLMAFNPTFDMHNLQVNHIDEIKTHNWLWNLEWVTCSENRQYSINSGLIKIYGEDSPLAVLTNEEADKIGYLLSIDFSVPDICAIIGPHCTPNNVYNILYGSSRLDIYNKYNLGSISRNPKVVSEDKIHQICKFIQEFKQSGGIVGNNFGDKERFYDFVALNCGLEPNEKHRRLIMRLYTRTSHVKTCNMYQY